MMLKLNPTAKRQWQHTMIVVATILAASLFGVNALQPFAAAANLETDAKAENGEGGVRVKDVKSSQLIFKNSKNSKSSKNSKNFRPTAECVVISDWCIPGSPHYDPQGMVCANDGQPDEAYCNYLFGPNACVIGCRSFEPTLSPEDKCVVIGDWCIPGSPHNDPQGMVCANDGQPDEAYCNYLFGPNACVIGCRSFEPTLSPEDVTAALAPA